MSDDMYSRTRILLGDDAVERLKGSSVLLCGCGAVGGQCAEALVRSGIGRIVFADGDVFEESNLNRQILCTRDTLGMNKAEAAVLRQRSINPDGRFDAVPEMIGKGDLDILARERFDAVADCIDDMRCKQDIIRAAAAHGTAVFSSMGAAMHRDPRQFRIETLDRTDTCPVARILRKGLKDIDQSKVTVVYSKEVPAARNAGEPLGSLQAVTSVAGNLLAAAIIGRLQERYRSAGTSHAPARVAGAMLRFKRFSGDMPIPDPQRR